MIKNIRQNLKTVIAITLLFICTAVLIGTNEILAVMLPDASELVFVSCEVKDAETLVYTGEAVRAEFASFIFTNRDGEEVVVEEDEFKVLSYDNNVDFGKADVVLTMEGYRNETTVNGAFEILLGQTKGLTVNFNTKNAVDFSWNPVLGADGYKIYRSVDGGITFEEIAVTNSENVLNYQDMNLSLNTTYAYKVCAYSDLEEVKDGFASEMLFHTTPLETAAFTSVKKADNNSIGANWNKVPGAVGYEVYRSDEENGAYTRIAAIENGNTTSYMDANCELGRTYYYYVCAIQQVGDERIVGDASDVVSAKTTLNQVKLGGSTNSDKTSATLTWKKVYGAEGYEIYRSVGSESNYQLVKTIDNPDTLTWSESELTDTKEYIYKVRAYAMIDGSKLTSAYSGTYKKPAKVNFNYTGAGAGVVQGLTDYVGYPYVYGGKSTSGWDCSGFVYWTMTNLYGVSIDMSAQGQANGGSYVSVNDRSSWRAGDVLCYKNSKGMVKHVAIYLGNGQMIHALNSKYDTFIQNVDTYERWDENTLTYVRRYL